jgi:hypothetical protein
VNIAAARPFAAFLVLGGVCLLAVLSSRSVFDAPHRVAAKEYIEAVSRLSCGPAHQNDGCVEGLIAVCREHYGELCATFLLLSPSSLSEILANARRQRKSPGANRG